MRPSKITLLLLSFVLAFSPARAQASPADTVFTEVAQMPYFAGSQSYPDGSAEKRAFSNQALFRFIAENLKLTEVTQTEKIYVTFVVNENGEVVEPKILHGGDKIAEAAVLQLMQQMPTWEAGKMNGKPVKVRLNLPIKISEEDLSGGYRLTWGVLKTKTVSKKDLVNCLEQPLLVRDVEGNLTEINELLFEKERDGKYIDATSNGKFSAEQIKMVKKLKTGDSFIVTATVQKNGQFFYISRNFQVSE
ncbi:MAG: hypothetical protein RL757_1094 [Bacteroidota bacterium]|jgi:hypothetical protein